jgi:superfamily I DNA/RNA helicase
MRWTSTISSFTGTSCWRKMALRRFRRHVHPDPRRRYQDTTVSRNSRLHGDDQRNVTVVGDDARNIYSFQGANFQNILEFRAIP